MDPKTHLCKCETCDPGYEKECEQVIRKKMSKEFHDSTREELLEAIPTHTYIYIHASLAHIGIYMASHGLRRQPMGKFSDYASRTNRFSDSQDEALLRATTASEQNQASESAEQEDDVEEEKGQASETADQENGVDAENKQGSETIEHHDSAMFDEDCRFEVAEYDDGVEAKGQAIETADQDDSADLTVGIYLVFSGYDPIYESPPPDMLSPC